MFSVSLDTSSMERLKKALYERIQQRVQGACESAGAKLAESYRDELLAVQAPPHSSPGQIPHRYDGVRGTGYGSGANFGAAIGEGFGESLLDPISSEFGRVKNNVPPEFSKVQGDDEFLATFITYGSTATGAVVGFTSENSHVTSRDQNYLIQHDQGKVPGNEDVERPWVDEIYKQAKSEMVSAFQDFLASGATSTVPF